MKCAKCGEGPAGAWGWCGSCRLKELIGALPSDAPLAFGGFPLVPPGYEPLSQDEATRVLLECAQGKYHRESYQQRIEAMEKDGLVICRKK